MCSVLRVQAVDNVSANGTAIDRNPLRLRRKRVGLVSRHREAAEAVLAEQGIVRTAVDLSFGTAVEGIRYGGPVGSGALSSAYGHFKGCVIHRISVTPLPLPTTNRSVIPT